MNKYLPTRAAVLSILTFVCVTTAQTAAAAIVVNPGDVGTLFSSTDVFPVDAADLIGGALDLEFADVKHVQIPSTPVVDNNNHYGPGMTTLGGELHLINFTGFLLDHDGLKIHNTDFNGMGFGHGYQNVFGFLNANPQPIVFHGVHFQFDTTMPLPSTPFTARFGLGPLNVPLPVVGEWTPVPIPTAFPLFLSALASLGWMRPRAA